MKKEPGKRRQRSEGSNVYLPPTAPRQKLAPGQDVMHDFSFANPKSSLLLDDVYTIRSSLQLPVRGSDWFLVIRRLAIGFPVFAVPAKGF